VGFRLISISASQILSGTLPGQYTLAGTLESPNYIAGSSGWALFGDGSGEFNNVVIRGSTTEDGVILLYTGSPGAGKLWASIAAAAGTDPYGNNYPAGINLTGTGSSFLQLLANALDAEMLIQPPSATGHTWSNGSLTGNVSSAFAPSGNPEIRITSPTGDGKTGPAVLELIGPSSASNQAAYEVTADYMQIGPAIASAVTAVIDGSFDASGAITGGNLASGQVSITPVANTPTSAAVTGLGLASGATYRATVSPVSSSPGTHVLGVSVTGVTNNGLTIWIDRNDTTSTNVQYVLLGLG
jgi:hypothetical protein